MEKKIITKEVFEKETDIIRKSLEPCPICNGKADIIGVHNTAYAIIVDAVGCMKCNLVLEREKNWLSEPKKLFLKRYKNTVDVVQTWNCRVTD